MRGLVFVDVHAGRTRAAEEVVEAWASDHANGMLARDAEDVVVACAELAADLRRIWQVARDRLAAGRLADPHGVGLALRQCARRDLQLLAAVRKLVRVAIDSGHDTEGENRLDEVERDADRTLGDLDSAWPFFDPAVIQQSLADLAAGRSRSL